MRRPGATSADPGGLVWDDDLERLALEVVDIFGEGALRDAMQRALRQAETQAPRQGGAPFGKGEVEAAFREELRRRLRPN